MDNEKLLKALGRLSVETGSLACLGCGWEHDCNTHGCAILRGVRFALEDAEARAEKAEKERDAAVSDLETIMAYNSDTCQFCKNGQCYVRGGTKPCLPKWRGQMCTRYYEPGSLAD